MKEYVVELSRYWIAGGMILYTLVSLFLLFIPREGERRGGYVIQKILQPLILLCAFLNLAVSGENLQYLLFYLFVQIFLIAITEVTVLIYEEAHKGILNHVTLFLGLGLCMIARLSFQRAIKQYAIALISFGLALTIPYIMERFKKTRQLTWFYAGLGAFCLGGVFLLGQVTNGSKISYTIYGISFQPSELVKLLLVFFLAGALWQDKRFLRVVWTSIFAGIQILILVLSKDLGSALIFFVAYVTVLFLATGNYLYLAGGLAGGSLCACIAYQLFGHVRIRVRAWMDPWSLIDTNGYQIAQSLFAIGGGGWFGMGLFRGTSKSIPYVDVDFMFSALCEELGLLVGICVILLCVITFFYMIQIAMGAGDVFYKLLVSGLASVYIFQTFLTIGGGIKFIPLTGLTLPFVSYGGTSILTSFCLVYVIEGVHIRMHRIYGGEPSPVGHTGQWRLRGMLGFYGILFISMAGYLISFMTTSQEEMLNHIYNSRTELLMTRNYRGDIYARDGSVLAQTRIWEDGREEREYPFGEVFAHAVGYSSKGRMGVESLANYYLVNSSLPLSLKAKNSDGGLKNQGDSVYTTLDPTLQETAFQELSYYRGAILVTEVETGKVLAMVSKPDFDPNSLDDDWDQLLADTDRAALVNRASQGLYPPGSTFKIVTALAYMRENPQTYHNYTYPCNGAFRLGNSRISCYHGISHGRVTFEEAFEKSCNSAFADMGASLDPAGFSHTLESLLFGKKLPTELSQTISSLPTADTMTDAQILQIAIGQGKLQMTPLHLHMISMAAANQGILMKPYLVERVENALGQTIKTFEPESYGALMTREEAAVLDEMMELVVQKGTATRLLNKSYTAAGKTGSAEYGDWKGESHAWFTGYAPADNPQICVTIIMEGAGSGGDYAVPVAKRLMDAYFLGSGYGNNP